MREVIARVVDGSRFREFKKEYGQTIVTVRGAPSWWEGGSAVPPSHLLSTRVCYVNCTPTLAGVRTHPRFPRWHYRE
jgi:hypothetical protein